MTKKFWNFVNKGGDSVELWLHGDIASQESWWSDVVTPKQFKNELANIGDRDVVVRINSSGGDVFAAMGIYSMLKDVKGKVVARIDGLAASAATIVAMAADEIVTMGMGMMMIHNPLLSFWGMYEANELRDAAETLDKVRDSLVTAYELRTKLSREQIIDFMDKETYFTAKEALEYGFIDRISDEQADVSITNDSRFMIVNQVKHDLQRFKNGSEFINSLNLPKGDNTKMSGQTPTTISNVAELRATYPNLVQEIENSAAANERSRIQAIDEIANNLPGELVNEAKYTSFVNAQELAFQALKADGNIGQSFLNNRQAEAGAAGAISPAPINKASGSGDDQQGQFLAMFTQALQNQKGGK